MIFETSLLSTKLKQKPTKESIEMFLSKVAGTSKERVIFVEEDTLAESKYWVRGKWRAPYEYTIAGRTRGTFEASVQKLHLHVYGDVQGACTSCGGVVVDGVCSNCGAEIRVRVR